MSESSPVMTIGSLCSGYGGLDMAAVAHYGGEVRWLSDNYPGCVTLLASHHPTIPNLGDLTEVNWADVDYTMTDGFGTQSRRRFAYWNHDESCLKMFLDCLPLTEGTLFATSCTTFPAWASMQNMALFERPTPPSLPRTGAPGGFASLPTPRAQNAETRNSKPWIRPLDEPQNLENAIARLPCVTTTLSSAPVLLPTPTSGDAKIFGPGIDWVQRATHNHSPLPSALMALRLSDGQTVSDATPPTPPTNEASDRSSSSSSWDSTPGTSAD